MIAIFFLFVVWRRNAESEEKGGRKDVSTLHADMDSLFISRLDIVNVKKNGTQARWDKREYVRNQTVQTL